MAVEFTSKKINKTLAYGPRGLVSHEDYNNTFNLLIEQGNNSNEGLDSCVKAVNNFQDQITGISQGAVADGAITSVKIAEHAILAKHLSEEATAAYADKRLAINAQANMAQMLYGTLASGATLSDYRNMYVTKNPPVTQGFTTAVPEVAFDGFIGAGSTRPTIHRHSPLQVKAYNSRSGEEYTGVLTFKFNVTGVYANASKVDLTFSMKFASGSADYTHKYLPAITGTLTAHYSDGIETIGSSIALTQNTIYTGTFSVNPARTLEYVLFTSNEITLKPATYTNSSGATYTDYACQSSGKITAAPSSLVYQSPVQNFFKTAAVEVVVFAVEAPTVTISSNVGTFTCNLYKTLNGGHYYYADLSSFITNFTVLFAPPNAEGAVTTGYYIVG